MNVDDVARHPEREIHLGIGGDDRGVRRRRGALRRLDCDEPYGLRDAGFTIGARLVAAGGVEGGDNAEERDGRVRGARGHCSLPRACSKSACAVATFISAWV